MQFAKRGARKIYVGKLPDRHAMKQEDINRLLVELALEGHTVTRLKGRSLRIRTCGRGGCLAGGAWHPL